LFPGVRFYSAIKRAVSTSQNVQIPANFSGEWWTNFAVIKLQQTGNVVSGTYLHYGDNVPLPIHGTVEGSVLRGKANDDFKFRMKSAHASAS
jgi:hypothetical protein